MNVTNFKKIKIKGILGVSNVRVFNNEIYLVGMYPASEFFSTTMMMILKLDSNFDIVMEKVMYKTEHQNFSDIIVTEKYMITVGYYSNDFNQKYNQDDFYNYITVMDLNGNLLAEKSFRNFDYPSLLLAVDLSYNGNILVTGQQNKQLYMAEIGLDPMLGVDDESGENKDLIGLSPMPAAEELIIKNLNSEFSQNEPVFYKIYDYLGNLIVEGETIGLVNINLLNSGNFYLELSQHTKNFRKQFIKMK